MLLLAALVAAFALRLPVGAVPPGLYHDEAYYGLDAANVLAGHPALFFPANNGREPAFIYLVAAFIGVLGRNPAALRLASAFVGVATVAATFAAGRVLLGWRPGLVAAWLCAVTPWPVLLARAGFRAGTLPLVLALALAAAAVAGRRGDRRWALAAGALTGLTLYTYTAGRLAPLVVGAAGLWAAWAGWRPRRGLVLPWAVALALVATPLVSWFALHPEFALERVGEVAVWSADRSGGDALGAIARNVGATVGMLNLRGDFIPRHNIPWRPVFGWVAGVLAVLGVVTALAGARRRRVGGLIVLTWAAVMAVPTVLAEGAPHFLRAVGLLPAAMLLPALGAEGVAGVAARRAARWALPAWALAAGLAVAGEAAATVRYLTAPVPVGSELYYQFEAGATELARDANAARGAGWRGGWGAGPATVGQAVWLDRRLRDGWAAVPFLVPDGAVTVVDRKDPILTRLPGVAYLQPADLRPDGLWSELASDVRLDFTPGALARGDRDPRPARLYVRVAGTPAESIDPPVARFANGVRLLSAEARPVAGGRALDIVTVWSADGPTPRDVTAFFQVLDRGERIAGDDTVLGSGLYPTTRWRSGDQVVERRTLELPVPFDPSQHTLVGGLYVAPDTTPVPVVGADGRAQGGHVPLTVGAPAEGSGP
jgi:4-amino-4-deoxy-L-arabinose transferase-like glycosyltransferase